jgi:threonine/homoserine/homoserine lactone efflux protein
LTDASLFIFASSATLLLAMPGPTNALLAAAGAARGFGNAAALLLAELAGYAVALTLLLALDGIAGSFHGEIGLVLRATAAVLLLATAWRMWRSAGASGAPAQAPGAGNVFLLTLFNPKALILGFAVFPPVVAEGSLVPAAAIFAAIVAVTGFGWILVGAAARRLPGQPDIVMIRLSSLVIAGFACYFAVAVAAELMPAAA